MSGKDLRPILKVRTGSHCHGTNLPTSDTDIRGIVVPGLENFFGLQDFQQHEDKEADLVYYGFRKFIGLACKGNLSILNFLHVIKKDILYIDEFGQRIWDFREHLLTKAVFNGIHGYCRSQLHRMKHGSGRAGKREDLVDAFGFDTKFAYHAVMITNIGVEICKTNTYSCMRKDGEQKYLRAIRTGQIPYEECMARIQENLTVMTTLEPACKIPEKADSHKVNEFCIGLMTDFFFKERKPHDGQE